MQPVDEKLVIGTEWLLAQINSMIDVKQTLLGMDCKDKNVLGFSYDTGYISALIELKKIVSNPPRKSQIEEEELEEDEDA